MKIKRNDHVLRDDEALIHVDTHSHLTQHIEIYFRGKKISTACTGIILSGITQLSDLFHNEEN